MFNFEKIITSRPSAGSRLRRGSVFLIYQANVVKYGAMDKDFITVTFDKSHLTTIGERLYAESLDLVRELTANAYDADASVVKITLLPDGLIVEDNGLGMDKEGLKQYFTVGSVYKRKQQFTPKFGRRIIGEFGIGKFAVLALCDRFELYTRKNGLGTTVIFDKKDFEERDDWQVPIITHKGEYKTSGSKVTLSNLKRKISTDELERKLRNQLPLNEKNFNIFLDGVKLTPKYIPGRRFRLKKSTQFGTIYGEIIVSSLGLPQDLVGVGIRVRGIIVRRQLFGLEKSHKISGRKVTGEVTVDFLPLTAGRDNFIKNSPEYQQFEKIMKTRARKILSELRKLKEKRSDIKSNKALSDALLRIRQALRKNKDIFFTHDLPLFSAASGRSKELARAVGAGVFSQKLDKRKNSWAKSSKLPGRVSRRLPRRLAGQVRTVLKDTKRLVKRIKIGGTSIVCSLSHLGEDEQESFSEGGVVFINRDHPLFKKTEGNEELACFYLTRLIAQEVVLLAGPKEASQAFEWQSRLLTDALVEKGRN